MLGSTNRRSSVVTGETTASLTERWDAVLEHRDRALQVARARLRDPHDVDDCVQEGMARVVAMPDVDLHRIGPLLSKVVANVATDTHRRGARGSRLIAKAGGALVQDEAMDEPVCDAAEARWLRAQLSRLNPQDRAVLEMRADNRTVAETAAALGISYKAAESAFTRARSALKAMWRATLAALGLAFGRAAKSARAVPAGAVAAGMVLALVLGPPGAASSPPGQPGGAATGTGARMTAAAKAQQNVLLAQPAPPGSGRPRTPARHAPGPESVSRSVVTIARPEAIGGGSTRVTQRHPEESPQETIARCLSKGVDVSPTRIRCRD
jgi:RNA polymerase sigma-70 factor (ECF subfamily)